MSNWSSITIDDLIASQHAAIVRKAQTLGVGSEDPVAAAIADVVARIRAAISTGNVMDADTTKIPNSLKQIAKRIIGRDLKSRISIPLSADDSAKAKEDNSYLLRISADKIRFELPDNPAGSAEMQQSATIESFGGRRRETGRERTSGL